VNDLDPNTAVVLAALTGMIVLALNWWQRRLIAQHVAAKVEAVASGQSEKLKGIHQLVVSYTLDDALQTIEDLKTRLLH
jgi:ABC-type Fe3+ transport system permease subunit